MAIRARINWDKAQEHTQKVVLARLTMHGEKIQADDTRFAKRVKEAFVGKNTWSHHKVRLGRQAAGVVWDIAKHAVPGSAVADKVRAAMQAAGQFLINRELSAGREVSTVAKDLFDVTNTVMHVKMEALFLHVESITLWQREFEKTVEKGIKTTKQQVYLIDCYTKLLTHYRDAKKTAEELVHVLKGELRKIESFHEVWAMESRHRSPIFKLENELLCSLLFDPEVHIDCKDCCFEGNPVNAVDFYTEYLVLDPLEASTFELIGKTCLNEAGFALMMRDHAWFDGLRQRLTDSDVTTRTMSVKPAATAITVEGWNNLIALKGAAILSGTLMTKASFDKLGEAKDWFDRQQRRITAAEVDTRTAQLKLGQQALDLKGWLDFSWIFGFRGTETQGIDNAYKAYSDLLRTQLSQWSSLSEGQVLDKSQREKLGRDIKSRVDKLSELSVETTRYITVKANNESSKRRSFVQILDTLVQRELAQLAAVWSSVDRGGGLTLDIDEAFKAYRDLFSQQALDLASLTSDVAGRDLDARLEIMLAIKTRADCLQTLSERIAQYLDAKRGQPDSGRSSYVAMFDALVRREQMNLKALLAVFDPAP